MIQEERCECGASATIDYEQRGALSRFWEQHRGIGHRDMNVDRKRMMAYLILGSDFRAWMATEPTDDSNASEAGGDA